MTRPRKIVQYSLEGERLRTFNCIREAQDQYGLSHISSVCRGKRFSDGGYKWAYENDHEGIDYLRMP
ncbi:MAG: hypothetical protein Q4B73_05550 [Lachnospiraceae bacterium]|nr:hypothetical protein [Lachnospiraceae bacterium]